MTLITETWKRNSFEVECVRLTQENIQSVAGWLGGEIGFTAHSKPYIRVVVTPNNKPMVISAHLGDWILSTDSGFKHYRDEAFRRSYTNKDSMRYEINKLVLKALSMEPGECQIGWEEFSEACTNEIMKVIQGG